LFELGLLMSRIFLKEKKEDNIIMQNDEFELIEDNDYFHEGDEPEQKPAKAQPEPQTQSVANVDDERELSDDEMEKLFDDIEQEEQQNRGENDDEKPAETGSDDSKDMNSPEKKP
jgi:hypothetical protein